jgi:hypothetical protein
MVDLPGSGPSVHEHAERVSSQHFQSQAQSSSEPKSPEWQRVYDEALSETDQNALLTKICAAETTLFLRLQQMHYERTHIEEAIALYNAVHALRLKRCDLQFRNAVARLAALTKNRSWA